LTESEILKFLILESERIAIFGPKRPLERGSDCCKPFPELSAKMWSRVSH
jgi:hypothetical protein